MKGNRGAALATTLVFGALALLLGLALAGSSVGHLHFGQSQMHRQRALATAEAALSLSMERLLLHPDFGVRGNSEDFVEVHLGEAVGRVTFQADQAEAWELPVSTNNRGSEQSVAGFGDVQVPPEGIQLLAVGRSGGVRRTLEVVLEVPGFPYAMVSSGRIQTRGSLLIGGLENLEDAFPTLPVDELEPADLASNASGQAITIDGEATVTGNIQAVGQISLSERVHFQGEMKPLSDPVPVTTIDLETLKPATSLPLSDFVSPEVSDARHITPASGQARISGGLDLQDGVLYVDGDLAITGGVRGHGAILVNGRVDILDGAALAASNQVAVVAKGDVEVRGSSANGSYFQGLVYTEGDFVAHDCTLLGSFVANKEAGPLDPGSRMVLDDATLVHVPKLGSFETVTKSIRFSLNANNQGDEDPVTAGMVFEFQGDEAKFEEFMAWVEEVGNSSEDDAIFRTITTKLNEFGISVANGGEGNFLEGAIQDLYDEEARAHFTYGDMVNEFYRSARLGLLTRENGEPLTYEEQESFFQFDLNEFIDEVHRTRVVLWHEI